MKGIHHIDHAYFLGIGGIGMSALARYFSRCGIKISGYDRDCTRLTKKLEAEGMHIHYHSNVNDIPKDIDLLVYTPAIPRDDPEFRYLHNVGIPSMKRSEALQMAVADKRVLAVAGTHGKTTTSAFLAHILNWNRANTSAFVGGVMVNHGSNFLYGEGPHVIIEADEFDRSFLRLTPAMALIQAMDPDHLDIYGGHADLVESFQTFTMQIVPGGTLWLSDAVMTDYFNAEWEARLNERDITVKSFGWRPGVNEVGLSDLDQHALKTAYRVHFEGRAVDVGSQMPGRHNAMNAAGAAAVALSLGHSLSDIAEAIEDFQGIERRFEVVYRDNDCVIIDDYAHHPVEITAAIDAARAQFPDWRLSVVFQPHLYSRTRDFMSGFATALDAADEVLLLPIYPARELPIEGVSSKGIVEAMSIKNKRLIPYNELTDVLRLEKNQVVLFLGAGDIYRLIPELLRKFDHV